MSDTHYVSDGADQHGGRAMLRECEAKLTKNAAQAYLRDVLAKAASEKCVRNGLVAGATGGANDTPRYVWERVGCALRGLINYRDGVVECWHELPAND